MLEKVCYSTHRQSFSDLGDAGRREARSAASPPPTSSGIMSSSPLAPECLYPLAEPPRKNKAAFPVNLRFSAARGRHLVATRDIPVGEVVLESEAYASSVDNAALGSVCQVCFKENSPRVMQCSHCQVTFYCSEKCHRLDQTLHEAECGALQKYQELPTENVESAMPR